MKRHFIIMFVVPLIVLGNEPQPLNTLIERAAETTGAEYITNRNAIVGLGTNTMPALVRISQDDSSKWQSQLVARICIERMARKAEVEALLRYNWRHVPNYDVQWEQSIIGPGIKMTKVAVDHLDKLGLWYAYIEMTWKMTNEHVTDPTMRLNDYIPWWARKSVTNQPEGYYLRLALIERLAHDPNLEKRDAIAIYGELLKNKSPDSATALILCFDGYFSRVATGMETYPGEKDKTFLRMFNPVVAFADSRHVEQLENFITAKPALAELRPQLTEVRNRAVPAKMAEPPLRLGTNIVSAVP